MKFQKGDYVILQNSVCGFEAGDVAQLIRPKDDGWIVSVKDRESSSDWKPYVWYDTRSLRPIEGNERLEEEQKEYKIGDYVVVDNLVAPGKSYRFNGEIGEVGIIKVYNPYSHFYHIYGKDGKPIRGAHFLRSNLRFATSEEIRDFEYREPITIAGYPVEYEKDRDIFIAGCKKIPYSFVKQLVVYGSDLPITSMTIHDEEVRYDKLVEILKKAGK